MTLTIAVAAEDNLATTDIIGATDLICWTLIGRFVVIPVAHWWTISNWSGDRSLVMCSLMPSSLPVDTIGGLHWWLDPPLVILKFFNKKIMFIKRKKWFGISLVILLYHHVNDDFKLTIWHHSNNAINHINWLVFYSLFSSLSCYDRSLRHSTTKEL